MESFYPVWFSFRIHCSISLSREGETFCKLSMGASNTSPNARKTGGIASSTDIMPREGATNAVRRCQNSESLDAFGALTFQTKRSRLLIRQPTRHDVIEPRKVHIAVESEPVIRYVPSDVDACSESCEVCAMCWNKLPKPKDKYECRSLPPIAATFLSSTHTPVSAVV